MSKSQLFSTARKEAGFTLIELLTVIVIIGILAAIAIPVFTSQRARAQDSQTISDVRNIAVQAETIMSDPKSTYDDVTKANIDFASSKSVSWNVSGSASLGGYCIVAKNPAGKKYTTDATALTYDSLAGGVGQTGKACSGANLPVPNGSTAVGSDTAVAVAAPTSVGATRNSQTSATVSWTIPTDTTVTGYVVQRSATTNDADFTTVGTITSRTTSTYTDTSAPSAAAYYRLMSTTAAGTSTQKSNVATLSAYVAPTVVGTFNANGSGNTGSIQSYTVTTAGTYKIEAWGAQGGSSNAGYSGGQGAYATGVVSLTSGQVVNIVVGQAGAFNYTGGTYGNGSGGGGTFTALGTGGSATALVVAGGGSGGSNAASASGFNGRIDNSGTGTFGGQSDGCSGAGFIGNGNTNCGGWGTQISPAYSYASGANGGVGSQSPQVAGGYGGGGASAAGGGGGGGGYTGGYGNYFSNNNAGGGSYVIGSATNTELNNTTKANSGNGKVIITRVG